MDRRDLNPRVVLNILVTIIVDAIHCETRGLSSTNVVGVCILYEVNPTALWYSTAVRSFTLPAVICTSLNDVEYIYVYDVTMLSGLDNNNQRQLKPGSALIGCPGQGGGEWCTQ